MISALVSLGVVVVMMTATVLPVFGQTGIDPETSKEDDRHDIELKRCSNIVNATDSSRCILVEYERYNQIVSNSSLANAIPTSNASASQGQWKTHSDTTLGIEFEYPPNWEVKEKTNRFEAGPDLTVEEISGLDSFGVAPVDDIGGLDAELAATVGQNQLTEGADTRLIESVEEHTPVGGEEAYSFTYTQGSDFLEAVQEAITVIHGDRGYIFSFTGTTTTFDDPENVEIRERMLGSLQFLDEGESNADEDEDPTGDEEEEEEENGDDANIFN